MIFQLNVIIHTNSELHALDIESHIAIQPNISIPVCHSGSSADNPCNTAQHNATQRNAISARYGSDWVRSGVVLTRHGFVREPIWIQSARSGF